MKSWLRVRIKNRRFSYKKFCSGYKVPISTKTEWHFHLCNSLIWLVLCTCFVSVFTLDLMKTRKWFVNVQLHVLIVETSDENLRFYFAIELPIPRYVYKWIRVTLVSSPKVGFSHRILTKHSQIHNGFGFQLS